MARNKDVQRVFKIADDSLQGVLGHYIYVIALHAAAANEKIAANLPPERIPMTFSWDRFYKKEDLISAFKLIEFQIYQARISLITIVKCVFGKTIRNISFLSIIWILKYIGLFHCSKPQHFEILVY